VPSDGSLQTCFVCHLTWRKVELTGDDVADVAAVRSAGGDGPWAATWYPLMVDVADGPERKKIVTLDCAFVFYP
jgi:hypothetical protein